MRRSTQEARRPSTQIKFMAQLSHFFLVPDGLFSHSIDGA